MPRMRLIGPGLLAWTFSFSFPVPVAKGEQAEGLPPLGQPVQGSRKEVSRCFAREVNQQAIGFLRTHYCLCAPKTVQSNPPTTTSALGPEHTGPRDQTEPLLVHRTPILYSSQLAHNDIQEDSTDEE